MDELGWRTVVNDDKSHAGKLIVGFSLRQSPLLFDKVLPREKCPFLDGPDLVFHQPISLGFDFWDVSEDDEFAVERNGMNLLSLPDTFGLEEAMPEKSCLLAVDMQQREARSIQERFGLCLLPIGLIALSPNWRFLGYDVVAPRGLTSGLYQYDCKNFSHSEWQRFPRAVGNEFGLIRSECEAQELATFFNSERLHHSPYYSMGVWAKSQTQKRSLFPTVGTRTVTT